MPDAIQALWRYVTKHTPRRETKADRQAEGNYVRGFRNDTDTWTHTDSGYTIVATNVEWQTFNLGADREGTRRTLKITLFRP